MADTVAGDVKLAALWDAPQNTEPASKVQAHSYRPAAWRCVNGHAFQRSPRAMQKDASCPICSKGANTHTGLARLRPGLASLFDAGKNDGVSFATLDATHTIPLWWRCPKGHGFQRAPLSMLSNDSCPTCALEKSSLAALAPNIAAEWHRARNAVTPAEIAADHVMNAWWTCPNGHDYQATVRSRTQGDRRCPTCYGGWSLENIRAFVKSLAGHIEHLNPSELFALAMQAGVLKDKGKPFVMALTNGRFPIEELEKFAAGQPSMVDRFASGQADPFSLTVQEAAKPESLRTPAPLDPYSLPAAPDGVHDDTGVVVDVSKQVDAAAIESKSGAADGGDLPVIETRDALDALDRVLIANADAETVAFLLDSAKAKLWRHAYVAPGLAKAQATSFQGDTYSSIVRDRFLAEFNDAEALQVPAGYAFRPVAGGDIVLPNLMQRRVAVCVREKRRFGNWSGMGAGKTLSAILATRVVGAGLTVICCPNAVVENWAREIKNTFADADVQTKTWHPAWPDPMLKAPRYLVMNFEQFQQPDSEAKLVAFLDGHSVDFVVIDEIHYAKQRDAGTLMSKRKRLVQGLVLEAGKKNADLCVLGMSGTPVINNLQEGKSLVEMITGHRHDDLDVVPTVQNCMRLYQRLVTLGTRWRPDYKIQLDVHKIEIDCAPSIDMVRKVGRRGSFLELEQVLTEVRLPTILDNIKAGEKVLIYTHYVDGIVDKLREVLVEAGLRVGMLTGETEDDDLKQFLKENGTIDVLIASSRIGTGVNGLQYVCQKLIINALPWTNAEYEQLIGRLHRQGSRFDKVDVIIPVTFAMVNGQRWSYCESKLHRLEYKKSIADAAVDGVVPEGNLRTPAQAQQDIMDWLSRLETGQMSEIARAVIRIPLSGDPADVDRRVQRYGDFGKMNNRWYSTASEATHRRLAANPEEWAHYHTMYRQLRESWLVVPFKEEIRWLLERDGLVVGDFGCGEAFIAAEAGARHTIHSFDHVAIDKRVIACDIAHVPLEDESLDLAIFCLSLMGSNFTDYVREAHRCLRLDGMLHIWEANSYFDDAKTFCGALARLGFDVMEPVSEGAFTRIYAVKNAKKADGKLVLPFRGVPAPVAQAAP